MLFSDFSLHSWIHILVFQSAWICVMFKSPLTFKQFIKAGEFWRELKSDCEIFSQTQTQNPEVHVPSQILTVVVA